MMSATRCGASHQTRTSSTARISGSGGVRRLGLLLRFWRGSFLLASLFLLSRLQLLLLLRVLLRQLLRLRLMLLLECLLT